MMEKTCDWSRFEEEIAKTEMDIQELISSSNYSLNEASLPVIQVLTNNLDRIARLAIPSVYLLSVSLLIDDFYQITFADNQRTSRWDRYAFKKDNGGIISDSCDKDEVSSYTKKDFVDYCNLPQRKDFLTSEVELYTLCPIFIGSQNIGCIILSLNKEPTNLEIRRVESLVVWMSERIKWILYSEYVRANGLLEKCMFLQNALDSVDEYQSFHSRSVAKLAHMFGFALNKNREYADIIRQSYPDFKGVDIFEILLIGLTHDIGKVNMSEFEYFRKGIDKNKRALHPYFSYNILSKCGVSENIAEAAGNHHESILSKGEPFGISLHNEKTSIESQIVKFADIIDSSIRQRDYSRSRPEQFTRQSVTVAMDAVNQNKEHFNEHVFCALLAILASLRGGEQTLSFYVLFEDAIKLSGMGKKKADKAVLKLKDLTIDFSLLGRNKWAVLYASKSYVEHQIYITDKGVHLGVYFENRKKEFAYGFCNELFRQDKNKKPLVCAFISHSISRSNDFKRVMVSCIKTMTTYLESAPPTPKRWRLLRFDSNHRIWK